MTSISINILRDVMDKIKRKKKKENIVKKKVNIISIMDDNRVDFKFAFAFDFIKGEDGKKKAIVSINDEKVTLGEDQSCVFTMISGDSDPIRLKAKPDFKKEGCGTTWCHDPKVRDEDI